MDGWIEMDRWIDAMNRSWGSILPRFVKALSYLLNSFFLFRYRYGKVFGMRGWSGGGGGYFFIFGGG